MFYTGGQNKRNKKVSILFFKMQLHVHFATWKSLFMLFLSRNAKFHLSSLKWIVGYVALTGSHDLHNTLIFG